MAKEKVVEEAVVSKRHKRREMIEKLKTATICILCVSTVYMIIRIIGMQGNTGSVFNNGADSAQVLNSELTTENILESYLDFSEPELIIINQGEKRGELRPEYSNYTKTMDFINKIMQSLHSDSVKYSRVSRDAVLKNLIIANSVYIRYPYPRLTEMDAQFFQVRDSAFVRNAKMYSEAILLPDTTGGRVVVYVMSEENSDEMLRIETESFATTLQEIINGIDFIKQKEYAFATELNLDKAVADGTDRRLVLDSMIAIPLNNIITKNVMAQLPWEYENTLNFTRSTDYSAGLMDIFGYNPNIIRQYVDKQGTLTFVSEKGTLSMEQGGLLKYKALDESVGVAFATGDAGTGNLYTSAAGIIRLVKRINGLCLDNAAEDKTEIKFTEIASNSDSDVYFRLDYFINGHRVRMEKGSAIEARVCGGVLTELKMHIKKFSILGKNYENQPLISALDEIYAEDGTKSYVERAELVYKYTGINNEMNTYWQIDAGKKE